MTPGPPTPPPLNYMPAKKGAALGVLSDLTLDVVDLRYSYGLTLHAIADEVGLTSTQAAAYHLRRHADVTAALLGSTRLPLAPGGLEAVAAIGAAVDDLADR